jgi:ribosome-binding protein aMBF1 (putative translation factor)
VVFLEPATVAAPLPADFTDIDTLVDIEEADPATREQIARGRQSVAENYYSAAPRTLSFYRLRAGWSQKELAARLGTSQSYVARLEGGRIDPQVSTVKRLASVLGVPASELLDVLGTAEASP